MLARELRRTVPSVTAIDLDVPSIDKAREHPDDVGYILGDFLTHSFEPASFDVIASVATLHHMDAAAGLARMRELLRPGGVLAIVDLARSTMPNDLPRGLAGVAVGTWRRVMKGHWGASVPHGVAAAGDVPADASVVRRNVAWLPVSPSPSVALQHHLAQAAGLSKVG
ncbi:class I SAM-dependent methyltransferase [Nonomuraea sp. NPDC047529]|uniref:class I SAM-dependent methyltransferase n=1 Tax=Nonomuraea sp. NPDC047529 TaxID=3155623 RepID=UPI0033EB4BF0